MQIIPFFVAFMVGAFVGELDGKEAGLKRHAVRLALIGIIPLAGYTLVFVGMGMYTTSISKFLFKSLDLTNQFGGVVMGLTGLYFMGIFTIKNKSESYLWNLQLAFGFLLGMGLAFAYKPCVTPSLTVISNLNAVAKTSGIGAALLVFYTFGTSAAIFAAGAGLASICASIRSAQVRALIKKGAGAVLVIASVLVLTGLMTDYKSFLVGRFAPDIIQTSPSESIDQTGQKEGQ